jgi:hypothetical protein
VAGDEPAHLGNGGLRGVGTKRNPPPSSDSVRRDEQRTALRLHGIGEVSKKPLQVSELAAGTAVVGIPKHKGEVNSPERVANCGGHGIDVDVARVEHLAHAHRTDAASILQPAFPFSLVSDRDLLGDPVDVAEGDGRHSFDHVEAEPGIEIGVADVGEDQVEQRLLTQPVGAHQRVGGYAALRKSPRILQTIWAGWRADVEPEVRTAAGVVRGRWESARSSGLSQSFRPGVFADVT